MYTADASQALAADLHIELRWLPTACPELNVMDCLWRQGKDHIVANEPMPTLDHTVSIVISYLDSLSNYERLTKEGLFAEHFWLADVRNALLSN